MSQNTERWKVQTTILCFHGGQCILRFGQLLGKLGLEYMYVERLLFSLGINDAEFVKKTSLENYLEI